MTDKLISLVNDWEAIDCLASENEPDYDTIDI